MSLMTISIAFEDRLAEAQARIEPYLSSLLDRQAAAPPRLLAAMRHAVLGGGKRFRPFLVLEATRLFEGHEDAALAIAAALECVHCYSLVHDDLPAMDNDVLRRGQPTVWKAFDEWTAILAGDALLTLAFEILAEAPLPDAARLRLVRELASASGAHGMVGGQALDLDADKRGEPGTPTAAHIRTLQAMKTGALIRFACIAGPIAAGRPSSDIDALARFGDHLGYAFQISDDLLDVTGDAATVGKAVGKDAAAGKATLVSLMGIDAARARLASVETEALAALAPYGERAEVLAAAARAMATRRS